METTGGSLAWEWIFNCSHHGALIRLAEDRVNAVGSKGNREALESACAAWLAAWREGIPGWNSVGRKNNLSLPHLSGCNIAVTAQLLTILSEGQ